MSIHTNNSIFLFTVLILLLAGVNNRSYAQDYTTTVAAGAFDRTDTVVSFRFAEAVPAGVYRMESEDERSVQLQVDGRNTGWFILDELEAGSSRIYYLPA